MRSPPGGAASHRARRVTALRTGIVAACVLAASAFLAVQPRAEEWQQGIVEWMNDPPQPFAAVLAVVNPLLRPAPLAILTALLLYWTFLSARTREQQRQIVRVAVVAFVVAEVLVQVLKRLANQPRPSAVISGLDTHGYPREPFGHSFPSSHTAVAVALVAGLWPWMDLRRRVVGTTLAALVALNRVYIGAHWPLDVVGGAAAGIVAASVARIVEPAEPSPPLPN